MGSGSGSNPSQTVGDALNAARADAFGKYVVVGNTLTLYAPDGVTIVRTLTYDNIDLPTQRTPRAVEPTLFDSHRAAS